jgi:hypothetical protein
LKQKRRACDLRGTPSEICKQKGRANRPSVIRLISVPVHPWSKEKRTKHSQTDLERFTAGKRLIQPDRGTDATDDAHDISGLRFLKHYIGSRLSHFKAHEKP